MAATNEYYVSEMVVHKPYPNDDTYDHMIRTASIVAGKDMETSWQDLEKKNGNNSL